MAQFPYRRTIENPTNKVYIDPQTLKNTEIMPAGALTATGEWVPLFADENGILFTRSDAMPGLPAFHDAQTAIIPGTRQLLLSGTVAPDRTRNVSQVLVVTRAFGDYEILANGAMIGSGRTGPGGTPPMSFSPPRPLPPGTVYEVYFTSILQTPEPMSVECYVQATDS